MLAMSPIDTPRRAPARARPSVSALAIVETVRYCGYELADFCISQRGDAVWGHVELPDRASVVVLVQELAHLRTHIEVDVVPLAHDGRGRWSVKLRAGLTAGEPRVHDDSGSPRDDR